MEATGIVHHVGETKQITDNLKVKDFVIKTEDKYPQYVKFEALNKHVEQAEKLWVGQKVTVKFNLTGKEYKGNYYNRLAAWSITHVDENADIPVQKKAATKKVINNFEKDDDMPF